VSETVKVGIISDTHDHLEATEKAFRLFEKERIQGVLHLGDIISPFVVDVMRGAYSGEIVAVYGNNDGDHLFLQEKFHSNGAHIHRSPKELELDGKRILMMHEPVAVETLARSGEYDIVAYGHLHETRLERIGDCWLVNPGAASGYLQGKRTLALLHLGTEEAQIKEF
jgi:putative phosphoesterase